MEAAVSIKHVSVTLAGKVVALRDVSADLPAGKTIGVIGPSGAGKTTLIRGIVGRLQIPKGTITVFGHAAGSSRLRRMVSYMTQEVSVYDDLTVRQNLSYFVTVTGQPRGQAKEIIAAVLQDVDLTDKTDVLVRNLSGGQKQRVSLAIALIGAPKLMVLDEPTVGLDPVLRARLWKLFDRLAREGTTLIITSHSMDEAERCDDLLLIRDGLLISHSSPAELRARTGTKTIEESFLKLAGGAA